MIVPGSIRIDQNRSKMEVVNVGSSTFIINNYYNKSFNYYLIDVYPFKPASTQNNIEAYLTVFCADSYNGTNNIVMLASSGGCVSGYSLGSRMILDGTYNTNSGRGFYGSYIYWQSQNSGD